MVAAVDAPSIYDIPKVLHGEGLDAYVVRRLGLRVPGRRLDGLGRAAAPRAPAGAPGRGRPGRQVRRPARRLPVGHRGVARRRVRQRRQGRPALGRLRRPARRPEGARARARAASTRSASRAASACAASRARSARCAGPARTQVPALGLCLGLQCMVIEYARTWPGSTAPARTEFDPEHAAPGDRDDGGAEATSSPASGDMGGTMRLGLYPAVLAEGSLVARGLRRRARRGAAPAPLRGQQRLPRAARGGRARRSPAISPDGRLVEFVELPRDVHPYYVSTQAHPEFRSRPDRAHPLFAGLVAAALAAQRAEPAARGGAHRGAARRSGHRGRRVSRAGRAVRRRLADTSRHVRRQDPERRLPRHGLGRRGGTPSTSARAAS